MYNFERDFRSFCARSKGIFLWNFGLPETKILETFTEFLSLNFTRLTCLVSCITVSLLDSFLKPMQRLKNLHSTNLDERDDGRTTAIASKNLGKRQSSPQKTIGYLQLPANKTT